MAYKDRIINHEDGGRIASALEQLVNNRVRGYKLYGFHLDNNESDPMESSVVVILISLVIDSSEIEQF